MSKKKMWILGALAALLLMACQSAPAENQAPPKATRAAAAVPDEPSKAPAKATIALAQVSEFGLVLVDGQGYVLYLFTRDEQGGPSSCYGACEAVWPPLLVEGEVVVGDELDEGLVGRVTREDGTEQVTYNGWPLYYYALDLAPGKANGQGQGGDWFMLNAAGEQAALGDDLGEIDH